MLQRSFVRPNGDVELTDRSAAFAWYELLTTDAAAARDFYGSVVGWQVQDASTAAFAYAVFSTDKTEVAGLMELPLEGRRMGATPRWAGYVAVDDADRAVNRLKSLGGSVFVPPTDSNIGRVSIVADPQLANFGIVGGLKRGGLLPELDRPGQIGWHELFAADSKKAFAFYSELFGWQGAAGESDLPESYQLLCAGGRKMGGMFTKLPRVPTPFWLYYFNVADIAVAVACVKESGGRVVQGPMPLPGGIWIARCIDPQGAMFSLQGKTSDRSIEPTSTSELNWAADWGDFASRGKVVRPKRP
ncbi:MAG TPA: VOC family protein [Bradyrhizobium sp.]|uniref:VOC family protein n=1 Tax=Bradyrhizobium sp. TaxID=376 RepID=UPI002BA2774B|nr:VOC family protein [Bradyrhizobium sp.]HLZ03626.1 VOC family protein [Bradyrhizobium sp.]